MGRAVMVGRGPTGAGVLVLSILIILTAESCRAQKGWWHTAAVTTGGAECNRSDRRGHAAFKVWSQGVRMFRDEFEARRFVNRPPNLNLPYMAVCTWSSAWFTPLTAARHGAFGETHHDGRVWCKENQANRFSKN